jgi:hypothetical protein
MRFERFDTPAGVSLRLGLASADLDVTTWELPATEIEIDGRREDDATLSLIEETRVELHERGDGHLVVVDEPRQRFNGFRLRGPELRIRVRCPHGAAVSVAGGSSDVSAVGTLGTVEIKTSSGDVRLETVGSARITSASGDLWIDHATERLSATTASGDAHIGRVDGELGLNTVSGDASVDDARGGATVQSVSGDVRLASVCGGDIRVQTVSGDATIALAPGTPVWLDVSAVSGDVDSDLELEDAPAPGGDDPAPIELRAKSVSGDLHVTRAAVVRP